MKIAAFILLPLFVLLLPANHLRAGNDLLKHNALSVPTDGDFFLVKDSTDGKSIKKPWSRAKKAAVFSACLPGLGQIYNKKYWKAPVIYLAMGGLGYSIVSNHKKYKKYSDALVLRGDNITSNDTYTQYSTDNLIVLKRAFRKYRDLSIMAAAFVYVLQIVDANVDGHLSTFDVDNISFHLSPWNGNDERGRNYNGLCLNFNLKK